MTSPSIIETRRDVSCLAILAATLIGVAVLRINPGNTLTTPSFWDAAQGIDRATCQAREESPTRFRISLRYTASPCLGEGRIRVLRLPPEECQSLLPY